MSSALEEIKMDVKMDAWAGYRTFFITTLRERFRFD